MSAQIPLGPSSYRPRGSFVSDLVYHGWRIWFTAFASSRQGGHL